MGAGDDDEGWPPKGTLPGNGDALAVAGHRAESARAAGETFTVAIAAGRGAIMGPARSPPTM